MGIRNAKIYKDGTHYIAINSDMYPRYPKRTGQRTKPPVTPQRQAFEKAYAESQVLPKKQRRAEIDKALIPLFKDEGERQLFIQQETERKKRNEIVRRVRLYRKINQQQWDYFCTFTYDDTKHTEESFKTALLNCFRHLASRKGWKYIGAWEYSLTNNRLHFHGIFVIPEMIGELVEVKDYSTKNHRKQISIQNTHFNNKFGRSDFKAIDRQEETYQMLKYILKYISKTGGKMIFSRNLPTYFQSDIFDDDILCYMDEEERKAILADDFICMVDGEIMGKVSPEVIAKMPKSN